MSGMDCRMDVVSCAPTELAFETNLSAEGEDSLLSRETRGEFVQLAEVLYWRFGVRFFLCAPSDFSTYGILGNFSLYGGYGRGGDALRRRSVETLAVYGRTPSGPVRDMFWTGADPDEVLRNARQELLSGIVVYWPKSHEGASYAARFSLPPAASARALEMKLQLRGGAR